MVEKKAVVFVHTSDALKLIFNITLIFAEVYSYFTTHKDTMLQHLLYHFHHWIFYVFFSLLIVKTMSYAA